MGMHVSYVHNRVGHHKVRLRRQLHPIHVRPHVLRHAIRFLDGLVPCSSLSATSTASETRREGRGKHDVLRHITSLRRTMTTTSQRFSRHLRFLSVQVVYVAGVFSKVNSPLFSLTSSCETLCHLKHITSTNSSPIVIILLTT